jgi:hypothetical protein
VRYVPGNPEVNDLGGTPRGGMPAGLPPLIALALIGAGGLCLVPIHVQRRLLTDGRAAPARVTGHRRHSRSRGATQGVLTFEFSLLSGAVAAGRSYTAKPAAAGSVIWVVYDQESPSRNAVYPLTFVTPVR